MGRHIAFTINNKYSQHCGVTIRSIVLNNPDSNFTFHIVCSDILSDKNRRRLLHTIRKGDNIQINDGVTFERMEFKVDGHATIDNYSRIFLAEILPESIKNVLYLDCDLVVLKDLEDIWTTDLSKAAAAVVCDPSQEWSDRLGIESDKYFNSGVMLLNLQYFRQNRLIEKCLSFMKEQSHLIKYWDQDVLNHVLMNKVYYLDRKFNCIVTKIIDTDPVILHYAGRHKPWNIFYQHRMKILYFKYLYQTPWFWRFTLNHGWLLFKSFLRMNNLVALKILADDFRKKGWPNGI